MGSRFTSDLGEMRSFMEAAKKLRSPDGAPVFFFDSYTNLRSVGKEAAGETGLDYLRNDLFLDNADDTEQMLKQLSALKFQAKKYGFAAAIGHIQRKHIIEALKIAIPEFRNEGLQFIHLSQMLKGIKEKDRKKDR